MLMDEKLKSTIDKIVQLSTQNPEFDAELRKRLEITSSAKSVYDEERIVRIEKYLGLDFYVDTKTSNVDYSFIKLPDVKAQLISDNREMMRFRYGTRYHEIDFAEFCRYAHFQIEMLLNYYYDIANKSDLNSIKEQIKYYNPTAIGVENAKSLGAISYSTKLWSFNNENKINRNLREICENLRKVRNELSHRSVSEDKICIDSYQKHLKEQGFPLNKKGEVSFNWKDKEADKKLKELYNSQINNSITELNSRIADKNFLDSENYVDDITYLITERMLVAGKNVDISSRLTDLKAQKQELQNTSNKAVGSVKASQAGCFVSSADGYESIYKYKNANSMTITKYNKLLKQKPNKVSSDTIGKLVTSVNWYVICPISKEEALTLKSTNYDSITVNMPYASTSTIPASIESINQDKKGGDSILVLKCNYMNSELASVRKENVEICLKTYEGIRVNKDALHTDYVTKITEDSKGNQKSSKKKVQGVYVLYGNELQFKQVNIIYSGSDFVICDPSSDNTNLYNGETISLYDNIVVKGNDLKDGKIIN